MRLSDLAERRVGLLGFGREGRASLAALRRSGHRSRIVILEDATSQVPSDVAADVPVLSGDGALAALGDLDIILASPGVPPRHAVLAECRRRGMAVGSATNVFLAECAAEDVPVLAVTGSKGKSTTSTLLHESLRAGGRASVLLGNVGAPALDALDDVLGTRPLVVLETSSYQAALLDRSVEIVVITELFPEHLDWHGSFEAYARDKLRLAALQDPEALTIWNGSSPELARRAPLGPARHEAFAVPGGVHFADGWFRRGGERIFDDGGVLLRGAHNRRNACAVLAACAAVQVSDAAVAEVLARFGGLPHRLESLGVHGGLLWINDAISTAPEAGVAAIEAHAGEASALIAGGQDRGWDFTPLARAVVAAGLRCVALLPPSGALLAEALRREGFAGRVSEHASLEEAVAWTAREAPAGSTVLFSPSSPSYGMFRNFEERGARFKEIVAGLGE